MTKEKEFKTLSEKIGWVNSYEIRNEEDCHSSHKQEIFEKEDVKEFIKIIEGDILDLSILEINKNLTITKLVEKAIDKIRERAGENLI